MKRPPFLCLLMALPLSACPEPKDPIAESGTEGDADDDDDSTDDDDNASDSDPDGGSAGESSGTTGGSDDDSDSDTSLDTGEDIPPPPATGIQIVDVTADQGVRVQIASNGQLVEQRNVPLIQGRPAVIRAFYDLDPEFEPRDIFAKLYVEQTDGTMTEYDSYGTAIFKDCGEQSLIDCRYKTLGNSFVWKVGAESIRPGTSYRIELLETAPGHEDVVSDKIPVFPTDGGTMQIGVEDSYMKMRVVLVPVEHTVAGDCQDPPDILEEFGEDSEGNPRTVADYFGERLMAYNPVDEVEIIPHDPVGWSGSLTNGSLLGALSNLRAQENAPPEQFYYAVARPCQGNPDFAGIANIGGPTVGDAQYRVGWGVYYGSLATTTDTFAHEIGHEQGRAHIACNDEAGVDPSYPDHPEGDLLNWGIDVMADALKVYSPDAHDYMTYCGNTWVSEWGYNKVFPWIEEMSSWELGDYGQSEQPLLVGNMYEDGTEEWYTTTGYMPWSKVDPAHVVRFSHGGVVTDETPAAWVKWERSESVNVIVPLPTDFASVTEVSLDDATGQARALPRSAIRATPSRRLVSLSTP